MSDLAGVEGSPILDRRLAPGEGLAAEVDAGQRLRIADVEGQQVANLVGYRRDDPTEFIETSFSYSQIRRKDEQLTLYSDRGNRLLEATDDTVGVHYLRGDLCTAGEIETRFDVESAPNCHDSLQRALSGHGVPDWLPFPVSVFRSVEERRNAYDIRPAASGPGDRIEFEAAADVLVGVCACPNRWDARNGFDPSPVDVTVYRPTGGGARE